MSESVTKCTVLVVDDDPGLTRTLRDFLVEEGYLVEIAHDGEQALAVQERNPRISLALLDLMMPPTDGISLTEQLRRHNPDLAVMIMTGFGTIETAVEAIKRGAEDYLTKPLEPDAVKKKVGGRPLSKRGSHGRSFRVMNCVICTPSYGTTPQVALYSRGTPSVDGRHFNKSPALDVTPFVLPTS